MARYGYYTYRTKYQRNPVLGPIHGHLPGSEFPSRVPPVEIHQFNGSNIDGNCEMYGGRQNWDCREQNYCDNGNNFYGCDYDEGNNYQDPNNQYSEEHAYNQGHHEYGNRSEENRPRSRRNKRRKSHLHDVYGPNFDSTEDYHRPNDRYYHSTFPKRRKIKNTHQQLAYNAESSCSKSADEPKCDTTVPSSKKTFNSNTKPTSSNKSTVEKSSTCSKNPEKDENDETVDTAETNNHEQLGKDKNDLLPKGDTNKTDPAGSNKIEINISKEEHHKLVNRSDDLRKNEKSTKLAEIDANIELQLQSICNEYMPISVDNIDKSKSFLDNCPFMDNFQIVDMDLGSPTEKRSVTTDDLLHQLNGVIDNINTESPSKDSTDDTLQHKKLSTDTGATRKPNIIKPLSTPQKHSAHDDKISKNEDLSDSLKQSKRKHTTSPEDLKMKPRRLSHYDTKVKDPCCRSTMVDNSYDHTKSKIVSRRLSHAFEDSQLKSKKPHTQVSNESSRSKIQTKFSKLEDSCEGNRSKSLTEKLPSLADSIKPAEDKHHSDDWKSVYFPNLSKTYTIPKIKNTFSEVDEPFLKPLHTLYEQNEEIKKSDKETVTPIDKQDIATTESLKNINKFTNRSSIFKQTKTKAYTKCVNKLTESVKGPSLKLSNEKLRKTTQLSVKDSKKPNSNLRTKLQKKYSITVNNRKKQLKTSPCTSNSVVEASRSKNIKKIQPDNIITSRHDAVNCERNNEDRENVSQKKYPQSSNEHENIKSIKIPLKKYVSEGASFKNSVIDHNTSLNHTKVTNKLETSNMSNVIDDSSINTVHCEENNKEHEHLLQNIQSIFANTKSIKSARRKSVNDCAFFKNSNIEHNTDNRSGIKHSKFTKKSETSNMSNNKNVNHATDFNITDESSNETVDCGYNNKEQENLLQNRDSQSIFGNTKSIKSAHRKSVNGSACFKNSNNEYNIDRHHGLKHSKVTKKSETSNVYNNKNGKNVNDVGDFNITDESSNETVDCGYNNKEQENLLQNRDSQSIFGNTKSIKSARRKSVNETASLKNSSIENNTISHLVINHSKITKHPETSNLFSNKNGKYINNTIDCNESSNSADDCGQNVSRNTDSQSICEIPKSIKNTRRKSVRENVPFKNFKFNNEIDKTNNKNIASIKNNSQLLKHFKSKKLVISLELLNLQKIIKTNNDKKLKQADIAKNNNLESENNLEAASSKNMDEKDLSTSAKMENLTSKPVLRVFLAEISEIPDFVEKCHPLILSQFPQIQKVRPVSADNECCEQATLMDMPDIQEAQLTIIEIEDPQEVIEIKPIIPIIDLTKENPEKNVDNNLFQIFNECTSTQITEKITLYRSDETASSSLDLQAVSASLDGSSVLENNKNKEDSIKKEIVTVNNEIDKTIDSTATCTAEMELSLSKGSAVLKDNSTDQKKSFDSKASIQNIDDAVNTNLPVVESTDKAQNSTTITSNVQIPEISEVDNNSDQNLQNQTNLSTITDVSRNSNINNQAVKDSPVTTNPIQTCVTISKPIQLCINTDKDGGNTQISTSQAAGGGSNSNIPNSNVVHNLILIRENNTTIQTPFQVVGNQMSQQQLGNISSTLPTGNLAHSNNNQFRQQFQNPLVVENRSQLTETSSTGATTEQVSATTSAATLPVPTIQTENWQDLLAQYVHLAAHNRMLNIAYLNWLKNECVTPYINDMELKIIEGTQEFRWGLYAQSLMYRLKNITVFEPVNYRPDSVVLGIFRKLYNRVGITLIQIFLHLDNIMSKTKDFYLNHLYLKHFYLYINRNFTEIKFRSQQQPVRSNYVYTSEQRLQLNKQIDFCNLLTAKFNSTLDNSRRKFNENIRSNTINYYPNSQFQTTQIASQNKSMPTLTNVRCRTSNLDVDSNRRRYQNKHFSTGPFMQQQYLNKNPTIQQLNRPTLPQQSSSIPNYVPNIGSQSKNVCINQILMSPHRSQSSVSSIANNEPAGTTNRSNSSLLEQCLVQNIHAPSSNLVSIRSNTYLRQLSTGNCTQKSGDLSLNELLISNNSFVRQLNTQVGNASPLSGALPSKSSIEQSAVPHTQQGGTIVSMQSPVHHTQLGGTSPLSSVQTLRQSSPESVSNTSSAQSVVPLTFKIPITKQIRQFRKNSGTTSPLNADSCSNSPISNSSVSPVSLNREPVLIRSTNKGHIYAPMPYIPNYVNTDDEVSRESSANESNVNVAQDVNSTIEAEDRCSNTSGYVSKSQSSNISPTTTMTPPIDDSIESADIIDLTWLDDFGSDELKEELDFIIKKEEVDEEEVILNQEQFPEAPSPSDSGIEDCPSQYEYSELVFSGRTCICDKPADYLCGCRLVMYCSEQCQNKDWAEHKKVCARASHRQTTQNDQ